jgi:hypothetical protein
MEDEQYINDAAKSLDNPAGDGETDGAIQPNHVRNLPVQAPLHGRRLGIGEFWRNRYFNGHRKNPVEA